MDRTSMRFLGSVQEEPGRRMKFMKRRRISRLDRNGDPLEGIVNLFAVAVALAVAFLVLGLTALGLSDLLTSENVTIVTDPGTPEMKVVVKDGDEIKQLDLTTAPEVSGVGSLLGSFYELADGTVVYVPASSLGDTTPEVTPTTPGVTPVPGVTPTPGVTVTPSLPPAPNVTPTVPGSGVTITPSPNDDL